MAMSHKDCDHEATPRARSICRSRQGDPTQIQAKVDEIVGRPKMIVVPRGRTGRAPLGVGRSLKREKKPQRLLTEGDLADGIPHAFAGVIRKAWEEGWEVKSGTPFNDHEKRIIITNPRGEVALVWKDGQPHGVWAAFWRKTGSSVTKKITGAPILADAIVKLDRGDRVEDPQ